MNYNDDHDDDGKNKTMMKAHCRVVTDLYENNTGLFGFKLEPSQCLVVVFCQLPCLHAHDLNLSIEIGITITYYIQARSREVPLCLKRESLLLDMVVFGYH
jgi:hypothetical protein